MNIRGGLSSPQDNGFWFMGSWISSTPEKRIPPRSNPPTYDGYEYPFGRETWQSLAGTSNVYSQSIQNNNAVTQHSNLTDNVDRSSGHYGDLYETNQMLNYKGHSFQALLQSEGPGWNEEVEEFPIDDTDFVPSTNRPMFPSLHSQGRSNYEDIDNILINQQHKYHTSRSRNLENLPVKSNAFPQFDGNREHTLTERMLPPLENHSSGSLSFSQSCNLLPQYEFLSSHKPNYDPNLEQRLLASTKPSNVKSLHGMPPIVSPSIMSGDQLLDLLNRPIDEHLSHEKNKQEILITTIEEETQRQCDGLLHNIVNSSSSAMPTLYPETCESVKGDDQGIYLKETALQKTPKRRKHRPKVIREGKPKRTPKPTITDKSTEKTSGKRKYIRRKGLDELATTPVDTKVTKYPTTEPAAKSCRRALKFDDGNSGKDSQSKQVDQEMPERYKRGFDNIKSLPSEFCTRGNDVCGMSLTLQIGQQDNFGAASMSPSLLGRLEMLKDYSSPTESKTAETQSSLSIEHNTDSSHAIRKILEKENLDLYQSRYKPGNAYMPQNFHLEAENQLTSSIKYNLDNSDVIRRITEKENSDLCQNRYKPGHRAMNQNFHMEAVWKIFNQTKDCCVQKKPAGIMLHNTQMVPKISTNPFERRGWKRNYPYSIVHPDIWSRTGPRSQLLCHETQHVDENSNGHNLCGSSLNIKKKKKLENEMCAAVGYSSLKMKTLGAKSLGLDEFPSENRQGKINVLTGSTNGRNIKPLHWEKNFPKQPSALLLMAERMGKGQPYMTKVENPNLLPPPSLRKSPIQGAEQANARKTSTLERKQCTKPTVYQLGSSVLKKDQDGEFYYSFEQSKGSPADDIIRRMKNLDLNERPNDRGGQAQSIVPYNGFHEIIPYAGSNFIKKRIPRPKVDLGPDTERVWNLLMGKEGSEGLETNKEKEKWWEEEREVFRGRADSFIARMHLVQGDRRFSRWKGSVIDSVVGVFLTQNVSDHLSSSAFMCLASRYPPKANINSRVDKDDGTIMSIHEQDISLITSDYGTLWCKEVMDEPSFSRLQYSTEHQRDKSSIETHQNVEEEVISSQDSDSSVTQYLGIRSCSGSNSEAEDCPTGYTSIKHYGPDSKNSQTVSKITYFSEFHGHDIGNSNLDEIPRYMPEVDKIQGAPSSGLDKIDKIYGRPDLNTPTNSDCQPTQGSDAARILELEGCEIFGEERTYSWSSTSSELTVAKDLTSLSFGELGKIISGNKDKQNGFCGSQETPCISIQSISEHTGQASSVSTHSEFHMGRDKLSPNQQIERSHIFQSESTSFLKPSKASEDKPVCSGQNVHVPEQRVEINKVGDSMSKENNQSNPANDLFRPNSNEQSHSSLNKGVAKISKVKGKAGKERNIAVDWDNLRRQVFANGLKKERSKDTMDSLDYEAVRLADVGEIAETIKERGMNNLLADRIKEFLNRVLEEHGSIDLEWLRDVPPEKAKDYLLSIRGLGLKSVECVRLLTLHHLAFPVDTNVGRIAVRLGWVPLQPLPESLQLHLLELYPVLESIQKFLWPRLCKLDQRTLYELHYQLITFGKVFCTKSKPNCNACPMRGECRHFASAFASARLALPGPEERGIVTSTNQIPSAIPHSVGINRMPLLIETGPESTKCEPIIEVPVTPEQESTETFGSDIEDSLFEDPDDIPVIKLNIEELKTTLQNFIPEGDMSMALVALNSAAASIPTPKLKNVSRLRTEHQVYELPDSHPLLEGMDKREPDDPSPYLLAIWKPGETADSFELEGKSCESRDTDRLCNGETCFSCNSIKEANSQVVRGTILVPCRTAMRGSFPLNGTYFQVNEVFADHESSHKPIAVPRASIWNLPRRTVYFGTSVTTIFKGLSTEGIQYCFWRGFVCVRGFDQKTRAPRPLSARLHFPASKLTKTKNEKKQ